ncbi:hypothetical protein BGZ72_007925 [Mortierella alpina]|nr:hypothetical protein BGZ72_007925 [Mortierella alpina]
MVKLTLPLSDNTDNEPAVNSTQPNCDPSQSIYDNKSCIKDFLFCSDDNPCPSNLPCIDRVCQCLPNKHSYITLAPYPVRMYTLGCRFDTQRVGGACREYEYGVDQTCLLNYCSSEVPCYRGHCDNQRHVCTNITAEWKPLPVSDNAVITLGDDPFGTHKEGLSPVLIILMACGGIVALAVVGCVIRTAMMWTKSSVAWAAGTPKVEASDSGNNDEKKSAHAQSTTEPQQKQAGAPRMSRMPSKFTGSHYMPHAPALGEISPFHSPLPSPHFSPYSQPNGSQISSNNSLLNPFRHPMSDSNASIELHNRAVASNESLPSSEASEKRALERSQSAIVTPGPRPTTPLGPDQRASLMARSQTLAAPGDRSSATLHKSMSMQQLGSRPPPPPPSAMYSSNLSPPMIAVSMPQSHPRPHSNVILSQADMHGPTPSLDSLISGANGTPIMSAPLPIIHHSPGLGPSSAPPTRILASSASSSSLRSSLTLQSGAERHPSLTVPARQSLLRHSASVPQMVIPRPQSLLPDQQLLSPTTRNLPAGFASAPTTSSMARFKS